ncbi:fibronectin type III domain-containing protein [Nonlabens ulvanivorans]|nr:fibronectin type III domain-containing protein [Nonlabens ulvanivorans]PRX15349.1 putative secreted protein (Por secretion system target) [Nonlabens ulvanivorans]
MKIKLLLALLFMSIGVQAQLCTDTNTASGDDNDPVVVSFSTFTCAQGQPLTSLSLTTTNTSSNCNSWYSYIISVTHAGGTETTTGNCNVTDLDIATFNGASINLNTVTDISITSFDDDNYAAGDSVTINASLQIGFVPPTCPLPTALTSLMITDSSADLSWTAGGIEVLWDVEYGSTGFTLGSGTLINDTTNNPYSVSGLSANTSYDFYVKAKCSPTEESSWAGPFSFTTSCALFNIPFSENFDSSTTGSSSNTNAPNCWSFIDSGSGYVYVYDNSATNVQSGAKSYRFYNGLDSSGDYMLISPEIAELTTDGVQVQFSAKGANGQELELGTITDPNNASTFTVVATTTLTSSSFEDIEINIPTSTDSFFAVRHGQTGTYDSYYLDDFSFNALPSCVPPTGLTASNIMSSSADLSWASGGSGESSWEVEYGADGFTQGSGTTITPATNPVNTTGLMSNTDYDYYVRAFCGASDYSEWVGPFSFTTLCAAEIPDYLEDFSSYIPSCWVEAVDGDPVNGPSSLGSSLWAEEEFAHLGSGLGGVNVNIYLTGDIEWLLSPQFDLSAGGYEINLDVAFTDYDDTTQGVFDSDDDVRLLYTLDGVTWNTIVQWNAANGNTPAAGGETFNADLSAITGSNVQFAIYSDEGATASGDKDFHIDNFQVRTIPSCQEPTNLAVTNITATSADLAWTVSGSAETMWDVEYGITGFTQGGVASTIVDNTSNNPYNASSLTESTDYDFYVRAHCGVGNESTWAGPFSFSTPASCLIPTALSAANITATSVDLSWTSGGSGEASWEVEYGVDGFTQGAGNIITPATNPYNLNGLTANTAYDYYVRANCGGGDFSEWVGPYSFTTACIAISSFPAFEDFEANNNCLDSQVTTGTTGWVRDASGGSGDISSSYDGLGFMEKNYTSSVAEFYSEPYDLSSESGNFRINVWLHRHGSAHINDNYDIYFNSSKSLTGATLISSMKSDVDEAPVVPSTGWYNYIYDVPTAYNSSNSVYFIVVGTTTAGFSSYDLGIDNLMMEKSPVDYIWNGTSWNNTPEGNITSSDNMIIQPGTMPSLTTAIAVGDLTIESGAAIEASNGDITVSGAVINNGSILGTSSVSLNGSVNITGTGTMTNLTAQTGSSSVMGPQSISQELIVNSGAQLDSSGNITLVSNAMGTARADLAASNSIQGDVNVERYIPAGNRAFRFIGSTVSGPSVYDSWQEAGVNATGFGVQVTGTAGTAGTVNATTGHDETTTGNASMFKWDASNQSWTTVTNTKTEILNAGDYYRLFVRGDRMTDLAAATSPAHTETTLRASGSLMTGSMTVTPGIASGEFFAFANPYQSKLSTENIVATGVGADMYYWDPALGEFGGYSAIPYASASGTVGSAGVATNVLDAGQAVFFVDNGGSASVAIAESNKVDGTTNGGVFNVAPLQQALRLKIYQTSRFNNGQTESDGLYLDFNAAHNVNVDSNDAIKLNGLNVNMAIGKSTGELLTVERRTLPSVNECLELNITNYLTTAYTINATVDVLPGLTAYLKDNFTGAMTELVQGTSTAVDFTVDMNNAQSLDALRFELVFQVVTLSNEDVAFGSNLSIYPNPVKGDTVTINIGNASVEKAQVQVFNTLGQQVMSNDYNNLSNGVIELSNLSDLSNGVYIINISSGDATTTLRFIKE